MTSGILTRLSHVLRGNVTVRSFAVLLATMLYAGAAFAQITYYCDGNAGQTTTNICYAGGNVMSGSTNAYVIYYGQWGSGAQGIVNTWLSNLGGTGLYGINSVYYDSNGAGSTNEYVQNVVNYNNNFYVDTGSQGMTLQGNPAVKAIVTNAISNSNGAIPANQNAFYFVLTGSGVTQTGTNYGIFCHDYIAYHNSYTYTDPTGHNFTLKYALVGKPVCIDPTTGEPSNSFVGNFLNGQSYTPNGNPAADGAVNLMFHELSEGVTDPQLGTWGATKPGVQEVGDLCEWNYGTWSKLPTQGSNGASYNVTMAGTDYLIQKLFQAAATGTLTAGTYYPGSCEIGNTSLVSSTNPSSVGQNVTFTAAVAGLAGVTPTGTVTFTKNGVIVLGTVTLSSGQASLTTAFGAAGTKTITAAYSDDGNYDSSNAPVLTQVVN